VRPERIVVETPLPANAYEPRFRLTLFRDDSLAPRPDAESLAMLEPEAPASKAEPQHAPRLLARASAPDGEARVVLPAPSRLAWDLEPGEYVLSGAFGLLPEAWQASDGATFSALVERPGATARPLFHRKLDPRGNEGHRAEQRFEVEFRCDEASTLVLLTGPGPSLERAGDLTWWSELRLR
jgi:hypothetical protein